MTSLSKTILAASVTGLVAGGIIDYSGFRLNAAWAVVLPLGAIFYGMFVISFMMEKEVAKFDEDEAKELQLIKDVHPTPKPEPAAGPITIQLPLETFVQFSSK